MAQASAASHSILPFYGSYPSTMLGPAAASQPVPALGMPPACRPAYTPLPASGEDLMPGRYYEQWTIGDRILHQPHRTVTETDNLLISALTHNPQPLHLDEEYAAATEFGRIVVNGTFTFALLVGLSVGDTTLGTLVANLGYDKVRMPKPVFIGDTLRAETEVISLKDSASRPEAGIVAFEHRMLNQRDEIVCTMERTALMKRRR